MSDNRTEEEYRNLTVTLGGRPYPLKVLPEDEELILSTVKDLQTRLSALERTYPGRDKKDCLAMLLLIYAVDFHKIRSNDEETDTEALNRHLDHLGNLLMEATAEKTSANS